MIAGLDYLNSYNPDNIYFLPRAKAAAHSGEHGDVEYRRPDFKSGLPD
jgi:hypothetical protein